MATNESQWPTDDSLNLRPKHPQGTEEWKSVHAFPSIQQVASGAI